MCCFVLLKLFGRATRGWKSLIQSVSGYQCEWVTVAPSQGYKVKT